jgi:hypothetical protein
MTKNEKDTMFQNKRVMFNDENIKTICNLVQKSLDIFIALESKGFVKL